MDMEPSVIVTAVGWLSIVVLNVIIFAIGRRDKVAERLDKIAERLSKLEQRVAHIEGRYGSSAPAASASPLRLTDYGEEISTAVSAPSWAEETAETLRRQVTDKQPYEVAEVSYDAGQEYTLSPQVREAMYEYGYSDDHVRTVLGIVLRDELIGESLEDSRIREEAI